MTEKREERAEGKEKGEERNADGELKKRVIALRCVRDRWSGAGE